MGNCKIDLQSIIICLSKIKKKLVKSQAKMLKPYGLSSRHAGYIMALSEGDGMTMKALSDTLSVDPANTTRVISVLTEKGYVSNDSKKNGSRKYNVFLTEMGRQAAEKMKKDIVACSVEVMSPLSDEEKKVFATLLFKMASGNDEED